MSTRGTTPPDSKRAITDCGMWVLCASVRQEREVVTRRQGIGVPLKRQAWRAASEVGVQSPERPGQRLQVLAITRIADVEIIRHSR